MKLKRICPICDCNEGEKLYELKLAKDSREKVLEKSLIVACNNCGFVFESNNYTQKDYDEHYKSIKSFFVNTSGGTGGESEDDLKRYDFQIDKILKFINYKSIDILDIGCAKGGLLRRFKYHGYNNVYGIDPSEDCVKFLNENNIYAETGSIFEIYKFDKKFNKKFDVITISHVLEHIWDLKSVIEIFKTYLKKDGILYVEVPDMTNYINYLHKPFYYFNFEHINHFTTNTLTALFNDFECLDKGSSYFYMQKNKKYPLLYSVLKNSEKDNINVSYNFNKDIMGINKIKEYIKKSKEIEDKFCLELEPDSTPTFLYGFSIYGRRLLMEERIFKNINLVGILDRNPTFRDFNIKIYNGKKIPVYTIENDRFDLFENYKFVNVLITSPMYEYEIRDYLLSNKNFVGKILIAEQSRAEQSRAEQSRAEQSRAEQSSNV